MGLAPKKKITDCFYDDYPISAVEHSVGHSGCCGWRGMMRSIACLLLRFATRLDVKGSVLYGDVLIHPTGDLSKTTQHNIDQNVNTLSQRPAAEFRIII